MLKRADLIESSLDLFSDYGTSKLAFAISEILSKGALEGQKEEEVFRLTRASIGAFKAGCPKEWVFNYYLLWFLRLNGVLPAPGSCGKCGRKNRIAAFDRENGGWICKDCCKEGGFLLSQESVAVLIDMLALPPAKLEEKKGRPFPKELKTMLYFNIYCFLGSDLASLQKG